MSQSHSSFQMAIHQPVVGVTLVSAVIAGLLAAWWLLPLGIILTVVMIVRTMNSPAAKLNDKINRRASLTHDLQEKFNRVESYELRLYNAVSGAAVAQQRQVRPILEKVTELVEQVHIFCTQIAALQNFYQKPSTADTRYELTQKQLAVKLQIETAADDKTRAEFQQVYDALNGRINTMSEVDSYLSRVDVLLSGIEHTLNVVLAETIMLTSRTNHEIRERSEELIKMITREQGNLRGFRPINN